MSSSLAFSNFDDNDTINNNFSIAEKKKLAKNKTLKKQLPKENSSLNAIINEIHNNPSTDDNNQLADFKPHSLPKSAGSERIDLRNSNEIDDINVENKIFSGNDDSVTPVSYQELKSNQAEDYYKTTVPYYSQMSSSSFTNKDDLVNKLDKIILLLEEGRDEKTGHVSEEIILYSFIGVFMIFIVDSFARAGKYVR
tara:strand:+ start:476 stop:1063 length:588 start_codon:yes stop_codon:yes gene_type:complete